MNYNPVDYKRMERDPIGCFEAQMGTNGWCGTKFNHELQEHLRSEECSEFVRFVNHFFKEYPDWIHLQKFTKKHGTEIRDDNSYETIMAVNFIGDVLDYTMHIKGTTLLVFPYRNCRHEGDGLRCTTCLESC